MATHIPHRRAVNNILRVYNQADEIEHEMGFWWYVDAHRWCNEIAEQFNLKPKQVAGIVAALSPGVSWEVNKIDTRSAIRYFQQDTMRLQVSTYGQFVNKARRIFEGEDIPAVLNGPKITAFYHNISNPWASDTVTCDRHAFKVARGIKKGGSVAITPRQMKDTQEAYKEAASIVGLRPNQLQAITWTVYKRIWNR